MSFSDIIHVLKYRCFMHSIPRPPNNFVVKEIEKDNIYHLIFTMIGHQSLQLFTGVINFNEASDENILDSIKPLLKDSLEHMPSSLAERLRAERMRVMDDGVSFYDYDETIENIIFKYGSIYYSCQMHDLECEEPIQLNMCSAISIQRNPINGKLLSFVRDNNIFVYNISTNCSKQLSFNDVGHSSGSTHFVIQEEFDRYDACWWRPTEDKNSEYHLLIEEFDESEVDLLCIPNFTMGFATESYRYPRPGSKNAVSNLRILKLGTNDDSNNLYFIQSQQSLELPKPLMHMFPEYEYLTNAGWTPDGNYVWVQLADRLQNKLATIFLPFDTFSIDECSRTANYAVMYNLERNDKFWVPVNFNTNFLIQKSVKITDCTHSQDAIMCMNTSGYNHLYLLSKSWKVPKTKTGLGSWLMIEPTTHSMTTLTSGEWNVDCEKIWLNQTESMLYFLGYRDSLLFKCLYSMNYGGIFSNNNIIPGLIHQLTHKSTVASVNPRIGCAIVQLSSITETPVVRFINISNTQALSIYQSPPFSKSQLLSLDTPINPRLLKYELQWQDGDGAHLYPMYGLLYAPSGNAKWPTLHYVYAGPGVRVVEDTFTVRFNNLAQKLNHFGYALLICDGRGSSNRGIIFEGFIKNRMGSVELDDQTFFLKKAAEETGLIDLDRVAIHGSSYGGYMTIMAMLNYRHVYKCGFSCSPVTDFTMYDTAYTERYLGLPSDNSIAYKKASVLTYLNDMPNDKCRLVIAHGGIDENVHFNHTAVLLEQANRLGLDIRLLYYPSSRHGISDRTHLESHMIAFLNQHLNPSKLDQ